MLSLAAAQENDEITNIGATVVHHSNSNGHYWEAQLTRLGKDPVKRFLYYKNNKGKQMKDKKTRELRTFESAKVSALD